MIHTRGTRRMFLKMEQRWSLVKLGVMPAQRNCCMGCLLPWWIHPLRCALNSLRIVWPCKAWMGCPQFDGSIQVGCLSIHGINVLSFEEAWVHRSSRNHPLRHPPLASSNTYLTLLMLEECFWGGYFIICWYTLIVTLIYWEKVFVIVYVIFFVIVYVILLLGLCYRICNFYVPQIFILRFTKTFIIVFDVACVSYTIFSNDLGWRNVQNKSCRSRKVIQLCSWQLFYLKSSCQGILCSNFSNLKF